MGPLWRKSLHKVVSRDLGSSFGHLPQQFMTFIVLLLVAQFGRNSTGMGEAVVHVRWQVCRTVVIKTGTLQRFIYWDSEI